MDDPWAEFRSAPAAAEDQWAAFRAKPQEAPSDAPVSSAEDFIKSTPRGLLSGISGMPNSNMALSQDEVMQDMDARQQAVNIIQKSMYQPQGRIGKFGEAVGVGLGSPFSYLGAGTIPLKIGGAVLSGIGSEAAGQAAEGTGYEGAARLAGALVGGKAAIKTLGPIAPKAATPTYLELKTAANLDYTAARNSGLELNPKKYGSFAATVEQELTGPNYGFTGGRYGDAPKTFDRLAAIQSVPPGSVVTASNIDATRKSLARLARETSEGKPTPDAAAASVALERLNTYLENIPKSHVMAGDPALYNSATRQGNANYAAAQRLRTFDLKRTRAENNAAGGIATSLDNQLKSQSRTILNNPNAQRGFSGDELAAMQKLNDGTIISNTLRQLGRGGAGTIPIMGQLAAASPVFAFGGLPGLGVQAGLAGTLYGARKGAEAMTVNQAKRLSEMIAQRSPVYQQRVLGLPAFSNAPNRDAAIRSIMLGL